MSGHRQAASALYGVSVQDQEAVLGALPEADQRILRAHLLELRTLGFDPAAMRSASAAIAPPAGPPAAPSTPAMRLRLAEAGTMGALLGPEPDGLLADVLALEPWPWSAPLLAALPAERKVALRLLGERPAPAPALRALLLAELDRMVTTAASAPVDVPAAAPVSVAPPAPRRTLSERWAAWTR